jgi:hypothetical protein
MTKYKDVEMKIDEGLKLSEGGKNYGFKVCISDGKISTTNIAEGDRDFNKCPETKLGSVHVHPESKDAIPSPKDIDNKT